MISKDTQSHLETNIVQTDNVCGVFGITCRTNNTPNRQRPDGQCLYSVWHYNLETFRTNIDANMESWYPQLFVHYLALEVIKKHIASSICFFLLYALRMENFLHC
jgi:hypothetical protein